MPDVRMPDGTVIQNVPEGTTQAQLQAKVQKHQQADQFKSYGLADLISGKMTAGLSDKAVPLANAVFDWLGVPGAPGGKGKAFGDYYQAEQADRDQRKAAYQAANPKTDWGTLPFNFMMGGPSKALGVVAPTVRNIAANGLLAGLVSGAGNSRGSAGQQVAQTLGSGAAGMAAAPIISKAFQKAAPAIDNAASWVGKKIAGQTSSVNPTALNITRDALAKQGMTAADAGAAMDAARARGTPLALMDTGDETRGLAAALARKSGANRTLVRDAVIPRQEGQLERVQGALTRDLGPTVGVATESQRLSDQAAQQAAPLYEQAYATPLPDDEILNNIVKLPAMQKAIDAGRGIHADESALAAATGQPVPAPLPENGVDVRTLDYAKRALQKQIDAAYSGDSSAKMQLDNLKGTRDALLTRLDQAVPAYAQARAAYRGPKEMADALDLGKSLINKSGDEITAATSTLTPAELDQVRLGFRSGLSDMMENRPDTADKVKAIVGSPKKRAALGSLFGDQSGLDNFLNTLGDEKQAADTFGRVATGSPTSANDADLSNLDQSVGGVALKSAGRAVSGQGIVSNGLSTVRDLMRYGVGKQAERVRTELGALLTETRPEVLSEILKSASEDDARDRLSALLGVKAGKVGAIFGGSAPARFLPPPSQ